MMSISLRRREVLGVGVLSAGLAGLGPFAADSKASTAPLLLIKETGIPESKLFAATLTAGGRVRETLHVGAGLNELLSGLDGWRGTIAGLTSDPAAMIASQLLVESGAKPVVWWRHQYSVDRWVHSVDGNSRLLEASSEAWPAAVAHTIADRLGGSDAQIQGDCGSGACALKPSSPGMLVSWVFHNGVEQS